MANRARDGILTVYWSISEISYQHKAAEGFYRSKRDSEFTMNLAENGVKKSCVNSTFVKVLSVIASYIGERGMREGVDV